MQRLDGPNAKLNRARALLADLESAHAEYVTLKPYTLEPAWHPPSGNYAFVGQVTVPTPIELRLILGDLIHNLRCALDHLVAALVEATGAEVTSRHQFPIVTKREKWAETRQNRLRGVGDPAAALIEAAQPFQTVRPEIAPLERLRMLSNQDKHQLITPVLAAIGAPVSLVKYERPPSVTLTPVRDVASIDHDSLVLYTGIPFEGNVVATVSIEASGPHPMIAMNARLEAGLSLDDGRLLNLEINDLASAVEAIVNSFVGYDWNSSGA